MGFKSYMYVFGLVGRTSRLEGDIFCPPQGSLQQQCDELGESVDAYFELLCEGSHELG